LDKGSLQLISALLCVPDCLGGDAAPLLEDACIWKSRFKLLASTRRRAFLAAQNLNKREADIGLQCGAVS
jgi:hypothetical protein